MQDIDMTRRWVVKIGSALLTNQGSGLDTASIAGWVAQMVALRQQGIEVVLVSSGSVAAGMSRLGLQQRPDSIAQLQAAAAVAAVAGPECMSTNIQQHVRAGEGEAGVEEEPSEEMISRATE